MFSKHSNLALMLIWLSSRLLVQFTIAQKDGDLRLVNGGSPAIGRVEVFKSGVWGTVCDDRFGRAEAAVICRQLGFEKAVKHYTRGSLGSGSGPIWMDGLECSGSESRLDECKFNGWGYHDCSHREDAGVECFYSPPDDYPLEVRLSCPPANFQGGCSVCKEKPSGCPSGHIAAQGIVQVQVNDTWHFLSGEEWTLDSARVVCGQLGYPSAVRIPSLSEIWPNQFCYGNNRRCRAIASYRNSLRTTVLDSLKCAGGETSLKACFYEQASLTPKTLEEYNISLVSCGYNNTENSEHCSDSDNNSKEVYRLRGGVLPNMGRVEVRRNGHWGTVCDHKWDLKDASVVCRNLGYGAALRFYNRSSFGKGINSVHFTGLDCRGDENLLSECQRAPDNRLTSEVDTNCPSHTGDAGVECRVPQCTGPSLTRVSDQGIVEYDGGSGWAGICAGTIDLKGGTVACRESRVLFAKSISNVTAPNEQIFYNGLITCSGDELSMRDCVVSVYAVSSCLYGVVNVVCTANLPDLVPVLRQFRHSLTSNPYVQRILLSYLTCALEDRCLASTADGQLPSNIRRLLRFDSLTMNYGTADFRPLLDPNEWVWHTCHRHYHSFENFITYDVLDSATRVKVAEGHKASFCLEDSQCDSGVYQRFRCSSGVQGISVNCGDLYGRSLDCQWVDLTDVSLGNGRFLLRQTVNADRSSPESDYQNNEIECEFEVIFGYYILIHQCRQSDHL